MEQLDREGTCSLELLVGPLGLGRGKRSENGWALKVEGNKRARKIAIDWFKALRASADRRHRVGCIYLGRLGS